MYLPSVARGVEVRSFVVWVRLAFENQGNSVYVDCRVPLLLPSLVPLPSILVFSSAFQLVYHLCLPYSFSTLFSSPHLSQFLLFFIRYSTTFLFFITLSSTSSWLASLPVLIYHSLRCHRLYHPLEFNSFVVLFLPLSASPFCPFSLLFGTNNCRCNHECGYSINKRS